MKRVRLICIYTFGVILHTLLPFAPSKPYSSVRGRVPLRNSLKGASSLKELALYLISIHTLRLKHSKKVKTRVQRPHVPMNILSFSMTLKLIR